MSFFLYGMLLRTLREAALQHLVANWLSIQLSKLRLFEQGRVLDKSGPEQFALARTAGDERTTVLIFGDKE